MLVLLLGGNPSDWLDLFEKFHVQLKVVWVLTLGEYIGRHRLEFHHCKTPGQQYREHLSAGGYRP